MASYIDGTQLSEYSFDSKLPNSYYSINKEKLIRFGLIGLGMNLYFEVYGGEFKLAGRMIEISYKDRKSNEEYNLTGHGLIPYNDIYQYKNGATILNTLEQSGYGNSVITQFNFGYSKTLTVKDTTFIFKVTCCIPYRQPSYLNIELASDRDFEDGLIIIRKNGFQLYELDAPLEKYVTYSGQWVIT